MKLIPVELNLTVGEPQNLHQSRSTMSFMTDYGLSSGRQRRSDRRYMPAAFSFLSSFDKSALSNFTNVPTGNIPSSYDPIRIRTSFRTGYPANGPAHLPICRFFPSVIVSSNHVYFPYAGLRGPHRPVAKFSAADIHSICQLRVFGGIDVSDDLHVVRLGDFGIRIQKADRRNSVSLRE